MSHPALFVMKIVVSPCRLVYGGQRLWRWLTEPAAAITEPDHRRQARLLARLLLGLMPLTVLSVLIPLAMPDKMVWPNEEFYVATTALIFLALAYGLSRTRRYILGAGLTVVVMAIAILTLVALLDNLNEINYYIGFMILPLLVSSIFLTTPSTLAVILVSAGATLLLALSPNLSLLEVAIGPLSFELLISVSILAVTHHRNMLEHDRQARLAQSEERLRLALSAANVGIWDWNMQTHRITWSEGVEHLFGLAPDAFSDTDAAFFDLIHPQDRPQFIQAIEKAANDGNYFNIEYRIIWPDKTVRWMSSRGKVIPNGRGNTARLLGSIHDITGRKSLEAQLYESQKMEVIGQLAGGIAHDFNNLLTVINGYSAFALQRLKPEDLLYSDLMQIQYAGERAAGLTAQLLAFSRKQMLQPKLVSLNELALNTEKMLRRLIGENINLEVFTQPDLGQVKADPGQLEQVILNLAVNARDAMPEGGDLLIKTANVELDELYTYRHSEVKPGPYVMLAVSDTGQGMDAETQSRIFEPFFTTKELGKGAGLGLATVYGIIKQSGGHVWIYSEPGHGTTFKIYLPRSLETTQAAPPAPRPPVQAGAETILLVEDDPTVRALTAKILLEAGYKILEAADGSQALHLCEQYQETIHLLITDVIMPGGLNGRQLAGRLTQQRPTLRVLYMSGYTDNIITKQGTLDSSAAFLEKPFQPDTLFAKVREVLDSRG